MNKVSEAIIGASIGVGLVVGLVWLPPAPAVQAQSSMWEVVAQPEQVAGVSLSIVRHVSTRQCLIIVTTSSGVAFERTNTFSGHDNPCETPEEREARERRWEALVVEEIDPSMRMSDAPTGYWKFAPDNVSTQPVVGQTSKQPGVPR